MTACAPCGIDVKYCSKKKKQCAVNCQGVYGQLLSMPKLRQKKGTWLEQSLQGLSDSQGQGRN